MSTLESRFWAKVDRRGPRDCWEWLAGTNEHGYGRISRSRKEGPILAHRLSYTLSCQKVEPNKWVLHRCDNPRCVNPDHLYLGTPADNTADMMNRKRHWSFRVTHCPAGHEYKPGSYYTYGNRRQCKQCSRDRAALQRQAKKAEL